ncbi:CAP domain-containing protein [Paenibacillus sp. VCA1]|uniref:CAP domain-containing protein n=1 Tax=Paenibacillus sp. VCA1 TaxID=3039148 RepID=UPI0037CBDE0B
MVKYIALAALILTAGCGASNHNVTTKQVSPQPARISTYDRTSTHNGVSTYDRTSTHDGFSTYNRSSTHDGMSTNGTTPSTMKTHDHTHALGSIRTQSSSTATWLTRKMTAKSTKDGLTSELLDLIQAPTGAPANQAPAGTPANQMPTGNPLNRVPAGNTGFQAPTGTTGNTGTQAPTGTPGNTTGTTTGTEGQTPANSKNSTQYAQQVLDLVNKERSKAGLGSLSMDDQLSKMAMAKAQDMYNNNYFDHNSPTYGSPFDMMKQYGISYQSAGENIAKGQTSPTQVMNEWMNSPGHKANILNKGYTKIGIAFYNNEWVQEFTG